MLGETLWGTLPKGGARTLLLTTAFAGILRYVCCLPHCEKENACSSDNRYSAGVLGPGGSREIKKHKNRYPPLHPFNIVI